MAKQGPKRFRFKQIGGINTMAEEGALLPFGATGATLDELEKHPSLPLELKDSENFYPLNRGGKSKTFGYTLHKAVGGGGPITGMYRYIKSDGTSLFLLSYTTKLYKLVTGTLTELGTDEITDDAYTHFETAYDQCIISDGTRQPLTFDGTTVSTLANSTSVDECRQTLFMRDRLFAFGSSNDPSLLYYTDAGNVTTLDSNFINCDVNDGQAIVAIHPLFLPGELSPVIIVAKERSIGVVTGDGTAGSPFTFYKVNKSYGASGFRSLVQYGQDVAYLTQAGVKSYKTDIALVNLAHRDLSEMVENSFVDLDRVALGDSIAWHDPDLQRVSFAVPEGGETYPNVVWHYDTQGNYWYKERYGTNDITAVLLDTDGTWYHGDSSGNIFVHNDTVFNFNGDPIDATLKTDYMDFYEPSLLKRILEARVTLRGDGTYNLGVGVKLDNGGIIGKTHQLGVTEASYKWGGGVWTDDPNTYQWGGAPIDIKEFIPSGYFRNIQFEFSNSNTDEPIDIFDLEFLVEFMERR